jgi:Ca2+-binding EF-hand superfamily protein
MFAIKRNLLLIALGAVLATPAAFAQSAKANAHAADAISAKTTVRESNSMRTTAPPVAGTAGGGMSAEAKYPPGKGNWWKDADSNGDGKISTAEAVANAGLNARFSQVDTNKDGLVTTEEYRAFYTSTASQGETHAAVQSAVVTKDLWSRLDADRNGTISAAEAATDVNFNTSFAAMDSNGDGIVSQAEYTAYVRMHK